MLAYTNAHSLLDTRVASTVRFYHVQVALTCIRIVCQCHLVMCRVDDRRGRSGRAAHRVVGGRFGALPSVVFRDIEERAMPCVGCWQCWRVATRRRVADSIGGLVCRCCVNFSMFAIGIVRIMSCAAEGVVKHLCIVCFAPVGATKSQQANSTTR